MAREPLSFPLACALALPEQDRRRPYQITPDGREQLQQRLSESARIAAVGLRRIQEATS